MKTRFILARQSQQTIIKKSKPITLETFEEGQQHFYSIQETGLLPSDEFHALFKKAREARHHAMTTFAFFYRSFLAIRSKDAWMVAWHASRGSAYRRSLLLGSRSWKGWQPEDEKSVIQRPGGMTISLSTVREKSIKAFQFMLRHVGVDCIGEKPCQLYARDVQDHLKLPDLSELNEALSAPSPTIYWKNRVVEAIGNAGFEKGRPVGFDVLYFSPPLEWIWEAEADRKGLREVNARLREKWDLIGPHLNMIYRPKKVT